MFSLSGGLGGDEEGNRPKPLRLPSDPRATGTLLAFLRILPTASPPISDQSFSPTFSSSHIIGHHFVKADWKRFNYPSKEIAFSLPFTEVIENRHSHARQKRRCYLPGHKGDGKSLEDWIEQNDRRADHYR